VADDGYVLQCLGRRILRNKKHRHGQYTDTFRFCNCTSYVYYRRDGKKTIKNFYGVAAKSNKESLGGTQSLGKYMPIKKKHFVTMLAAGADPYTAYMSAYRKHGGTPNTVWIQINKLLGDPLVKEELQVHLKPIVVELQEAIKKETGFTSLQDWLVNELTSVLTKSKLSPKDQRDNIRLVVSLFSEPLGLSVGLNKKKPNEVDEADWQAVPPELGSSSLTEIKRTNNERISGDTINSADDSRNTSNTSADIAPDTNQIQKEEVADLPKSDSTSAS